MNNTRNTFCGSWYLPHNRVHKFMAELCSNFSDCIFFIAYARNASISTTSRKYDVTLVFNDPDFLSDEGILAIRPNVRTKLHIFHCACAKRPFFTVCQKSDVPSCLPTQIPYKLQEFWRFGHKYVPNCIFFIARAQNGIISISCQKSDVTIVYPDPDFL